MLYEMFRLSYHFAPKQKKHDINKIQIFHNKQTSRVFLSKQSLSEATFYQSKYLAESVSQSILQFILIFKSLSNYF